MARISIKAALALQAFTQVVRAAPAAVECTREAVLAVADAWVAAQTAGRLDTLTTHFASSWEYVENNKKIDSSKGVLGKALKIDHRRSTVDTIACASYTEIIVADTRNPYVIGTQIRHDADLKVTKIDVIASTTGSWLFNSTKTLEYAKQEKWDIIPEGKRDKRDLIKNAGDAYMDMWSNATAHTFIPWGTPCTRLEGSAYTGKGRPDDSCQPGIPSNHNQAPNSNRRYVIDDWYGTVTIFCVWEHMMNAADSHEFRLEGGKLRYIHTMTECGGKTCRL